MTGNKDDVLIWLVRQEPGTMWEVKPYRQARTNRQNAYYWALLTQVADHMRMSKTECHNRMLRDYGQPYQVNGETPYVMLPDFEETEKDVLRSETYHLKPTSRIKAGIGHPYRAYIMIRGSHEYNTQEMSVLLDGLVQEAKNLNIETMTPQELAKMKEYDRRNEEKRSKERDTA